MKNLLIILFTLSSSLYATDVFETKGQNYQYVINTYTKIMNINDQHAFCLEVISFEEQLYKIIDEDDQLIRHLANTGNIDDLNFAKNLNSNKISDVFLVTPLRRKCESGIQIDVQSMHLTFSRSILNTQILEMHYNLFLDSRLK